MKMYPNYSVLMSVYIKENPEYLKQSIQSMLDQTVEPSEFIIIKDGPLTDALNDVLSGYLTRYPYLFRCIALKENMGLGPALALGVTECRNAFIARMDSDDISDPKRCEILLDVFRDDPVLDVVGCFENEFIDSISNVVSVHKVPETHHEITRFMRRRCPIMHPTVIFKRSAVLACGNYRSVPYFEDYDLFLRMIWNHSKCYNVQKPLYYLRVCDDFYRRRGGFKYMKTEIAFKKDKYKRGLISLNDYIISAGSQAVVSLMPNKLRSLVYLKLLRR